MNIFALVSMSRPRVKRRRHAAPPAPVLPDELIVAVLECIDDACTFLRFAATSRQWREECTRDAHWRRLIAASARRWNAGIAERPPQFVCDALMSRVLAGYHRVFEFFRAHYDDDDVEPAQRCSFELVGEAARAFWRGRPDLIPAEFDVLASGDYVRERRQDPPLGVLRGHGRAYTEATLPAELACDLILYNMWSTLWGDTRMLVLVWRRRGSPEHVVSVVDARTSLFAQIWALGVQQSKGCDRPPRSAVNTPLPAIYA